MRKRKMKKKIKERPKVERSANKVLFAKDCAQAAVLRYTRTCITELECFIETFT